MTRRQRAHAFLTGSGGITAAAVLVALWAAALLLGGPGSGFDPPVLATLYAGNSPRLALASVVLTQLGGWIALVLFGLAGVALLLVRRRWRDAGLLFAILAGGRLIIEAQKAWVMRPRPPQEHLVMVQSWSFPSAHAGDSMITYLALALLLSGRCWAIAGALALTLAIGISRMLLGVHWPSDVAGGWAFGLLWTAALVRWGGEQNRSSP